MNWLPGSVLVVGHVNCVRDNLRMGPINLTGQSDLNCSNTVTLISCPEIHSVEFRVKSLNSLTRHSLRVSHTLLLVPLLPPTLLRLLLPTWPSFCPKCLFDYIVGFVSLISISMITNKLFARFIMCIWLLGYFINAFIKKVFL